MINIIYRKSVLTALKFAAITNDASGRRSTRLCRRTKVNYRFGGPRFRAGANLLPGCAVVLRGRSARGRIGRGQVVRDMGGRAVVWASHGGGLGRFLGLVAVTMEHKREPRTGQVGRESRREMRPAKRKLARGPWVTWRRKENSRSRGRPGACARVVVIV